MEEKAGKLYIGNVSNKFYIFLGKDHITNEFKFYTQSRLGKYWYFTKFKNWPSIIEAD